MNPREHRPRPPSPGRRLAVLAAAMAGLAAGYLAGAYGSPSVPRAAIEPPEPAAEIDPTTNTTSPAVEGPLADRIPQTAGARLLMVVAEQELELVVWAGEQTLPHRRRLPFPVGYTTISFDSSGSSLAAITASAWDASLYVGTLDFPFAPAFVGATSAAWHPSTGGHLAWTGSPQGEEDLHLLYRGRVRPSPSRLEVQPVAEIAPEERVVAWGSWGYALSNQAACPSLRTLQQGGEEGVAGDLRLWDASGQGDLLVTPCDSPDSLVITDPSLEHALLLPSEPQATLLGAVWSPSADRVGRVVGTDSRSRLEVLDRDGNTGLEVEVPQPVSLEWARRDAIVMATGDGQVVLVNPEEGAMYQVALGSRMLVAGLR